jgi:8-oxo-dGTP pyrophosphatase MutT (NUDIX family)
MRTILITKGLILDADNNVLLLRRSKTHPHLALRPDLPGGLVEAGEQPGTALQREIHEETALDIPATDLELSYSATETWHDGSRVRLLYVTQLPTVKPAVTISWEHDQFTWLPLDEFPSIEEDLTPFYKHAVEYIRKNQIIEDLRPDTKEA